MSATSRHLGVVRSGHYLGVRKTPRSLGASVCRPKWVCIAAIVAVWLASPQAQQLLDRVVAVVGKQPILLSDVRIATELGVVTPEPGADPVRSATQQLVERQLMLAEVARFPPPEPDAAAIAKQAAAMQARAGGGLQALMQSTGLDDMRVRALARDTVRIEDYITQRFGAPMPATDADARKYYDIHRAEFTRDGALIPFEDVESQARDRATAERRRTTIANWVTSLRARANITINP